MKIFKEKNDNNNPQKLRNSIAIATFIIARKSGKGGGKISSRSSKASEAKVANDT